MLLQDAERCINWFLEVDKNPKAKMPYALLGAPGLNPIISTITGAVPRRLGSPGQSDSSFCVAATCYLATVTTAASQITDRAVFDSVGRTLLTNAGRVVSEDNGVLFNGLGGYAVLVDGQFGYFYRIAGAGNVTFTGNLTSGQPTISFTAGSLVPNYLLISSGALTDSLAGIPSTDDPIDQLSRANTITQKCERDLQSDQRSFTLQIPSSARIMDPAFP